MSKNPKKSGKKNIKNAVVLPPELQSVFNQALAHHQQGQLQQAVDGYSQVLSHEPNHPDSLHLVGLIFQSSGDLLQAQEYIQRAIKLNPKVAGYHYNHGVVLQGLEKHSEAVEAYRLAIRLKPDYAQAYENLGVALQDLDNLKAALPAYQQALALNSKSLIVLSNLGTLYFKNGKTEESLALFNRAIALDPANQDLHVKRSDSLLRMGKWKEGWSEYRWRFNAPTFLEHNMVRTIGLPHGDFGRISEQRVLITCEQGLGDEIMFASCFNDVIPKVNVCVLECDSRLLGLFSRSFPSAKVVAKAKYDANNLDCYISAGDLPQYFRRRDTEFNGKAYLVAAPTPRHVWRDRLATLPLRLNIGFSWRGGAGSRAINARSIELKYWKSLFKNIEANFINLQYLTTDDDIATLKSLGGERVTHFDDLDAFNDIDALAGLISELDLVISADNATVHLAGALGIPAWVILPEGPERRWTDGRDDSVWYDSVRLYRSSVTGSDGWVAVFKEVTNRVAEWAAGELNRRQLCDINLLPRAASEPLSNGKSTIAAESRPALLLNDTSAWYHWGCSGTSLALHRELRSLGLRVRGIPITRSNNLLGLPSSLEGFDLDSAFDEFTKHNPSLVQEVANADIVVVNGEGSLHGGSIAAIGLLYLCYIAKMRFQKNVQIINHSCYPDLQDASGKSLISQLYAKVYRVLDYIAIREPRSLNALKSIGIGAVQSFDSLPLFIEESGVAQNRLSGAGPVVLAGSVVWQQSMGAALLSFIRQLTDNRRRVQLLVGSSAHIAADDVVFARWLQTEMPGRVELCFTATEAEWLSVIANASVLVSGRFHHSIAAAFLGTPFIVCESNTPKISGLLEMLEMPEAVAKQGDSLSERLMAMLVEREKVPSDFVLSLEVRNGLLAAARNNFSGL